MSFVDEITLKAKAGRGGNGVVRWLHLKGKEFSGPAGGDGGDGGDIIFRAVRDVNILTRYRGRDMFRAENGEHGKSKNMAGKNGASVVIDVPIGSIVTHKKSGASFELLREGDEVVALRGGRGGHGNAHFKSSTNQYPTEWVPGKDGEEASFIIELQLIADAGFIGLPNAGKSSLLNALTRAEAKVGSYAFTTLEPSLGVYYSYVLADIPGLIEGASEGKGLGHGFLRHVTRTRVLIHCVPADSMDPVRDYQTVRMELKKHDEILSRKAEIIVITKSDVVSEEEAASIVALFKNEKGPVLSVSVLDDESIKKFGDALVRFLAQS